MRNSSGQLGLFETDGSAGREDEALARARMQGIIDRLTAAAAPPWRDELEAILESGVFQRAMRLVPEADARALWRAFEAEADRLQALWPEADAPGG